MATHAAAPTKDAPSAKVTYRNWIKADGSTPYQPEAGRYHFYHSYGCPWASSAYMALKLKGLDGVIGVSIVGIAMEKTKDDPNDSHVGWVFRTAEEEEGCIPDPIFNARTVREVYERCGATPERFSVPLLVDTKTNTVVNNESADLIRIFDQEFQDLATNKELSLFPADLEAVIEETNSWVLPSINNGVYRCGFATTQDAYDQAIKTLFDHLDKAEDILSRQRYLCGDHITFVDLRLFMTLIRFDLTYHQLFKCDKRYISQYPNLHNYMLDLHQIPAITETVNIDHIRKGPYKNFTNMNPTGIVTAGPSLDLNAPHDRARFSTKAQ